MSPLALPNVIDPLEAFLAGVAGQMHPIPLEETRLTVEIDHGLAIVSTARKFRNSESNSIEATITFPVPIHAALFVLEARIDGRTLTGRAQTKSDARDVYEDALERGKGAVLHEEVLRGVHMLSVGHIPPRGEVEVRATWAM